MLCLMAGRRGCAGRAPASAEAQKSRGAAAFDTRCWVQARVLDKVEDLGPLLSRTEMQRVLEAATEECKVACPQILVR
jgi:hypothetical protein